MTTQNDTPPSIQALLEPAPPVPSQIALHVTVTGQQGSRQYWMDESGSLFFSGIDGSFRRATEQQTKLIMRGLDLARRSAAFQVRGQAVAAEELDRARGLVS